MSSIPCSWCGQPSARMYPGRTSKSNPMDYSGRVVKTTPPDWYLCVACDALVLAGKPLPAGGATFSVAVREDN